MLGAISRRSDDEAPASVRAAHDCDDRNTMSQDTPDTPTPATDPVHVNADELSEPVRQHVPPRGAARARRP
jgi:hypothetical protein